MSDADLFATLTETHGRLRRRELSPVELTRAQLARIDARNPALHAYLTVLAESALDEARAAEKELAAGRVRGPLHGVPIGVKDLCDVAGVPTTSASRVLDPKPAARDSGVVRKLREAGAVIVGKLHQTEFAMSGYHPSLPVPVNPWDPTRFAGVSSSGSGVAAAAGLAFATIGTDTGGSIRFPAAACGVVGLKPTRGRVSRAGAFPLGGSLDHIGPLARSVADVAAVLDAIAGRRPGRSDRAARAVTGLCRRARPRRARRADRRRRGLRDRRRRSRRWPRRSSATCAGSSRSRRDDRAAYACRRSTRCSSAWPVLCAAEAVVHHRGLYPERAASYGPTFRSFLAYGSALSGAEVADAWLVRELWSARFAAELASVDLLACPSMPVLPLLQELLAPHAEFTPAVTPLIRFTAPYDFNGAPTLSLPSGFTPDGLPLSLQLVGKPLTEATLCGVGQAFEAADATPRRRPPHA